MKQGQLIVISGFSGVGKGTLINMLKTCFPDDYRVSVSATTRDPRDGEIDGVSYHFITQEEFQGMIDRDEFLEYAPYVGNSYGTPRKPVEEWLNEGKNVILEIEPQGALQVQKKLPDALLLFIAPPSMEVLKSRLIGRNSEPPKVVEKRLKAAAKEACEMEKYDYILVNDNRFDCMCQIRNLIQMHGQRAEVQKDFIAALRSDIERFQEENNL